MTDDSQPWHDGELLKRLYWDEQMTQQEIADELGCSDSTISAQLSEHGIQARSRVEANRLAQGVPYVRFGTNGEGYETWATDFRGERDAIGVHRVLAVSEHGREAVSGNQVHHKNGIPWDNRPGNIELLEAAEHTKHHNQQDNAFGWLEVLRIREMYRNTGQTHRGLADVFGVSYRTIGDAINGADAYSEYPAEGGDIELGGSR